MDETRRRVLATFGTVSVATLAGCSGDDESSQLDNDATGDDDSASRQPGTSTDVGDDSTQPAFPQTLQRQTELSVPESSSLGSSVAVSGDGSTAVSGADSDENPGGDETGAAYVFSPADGAWQQQATLAPDDGDAGDEFGSAVAISGEGRTVVVGATLSDSQETPRVGAAYVFSQGDGDWQQQAKLTPDSGDEADLFGSSVAVSGDGRLAVVGAAGDDGPGGEGAGSASVFSRADGDWQQRATFTPDNATAGGEFGFSVAVSADGDTAIIGADSDKNQNGEEAGSAYVFVRADGDWHQQATLVPDDGDAGDNFGTAVSISNDGNTAVIGADWDNSQTTNAGSAYVFSRADGDWQQQTKLLATDGDVGDSFGFSVAVSGDGSTVVVGAIMDSNPDGAGRGSAYVFARAGGVWHQSKLDDDDQVETFGFAVALSDDGSLSLVGAPSEERPDSDNGGSVHVFA